MVIQQFLRVLKARFGIIALIFLTTLGATVAVSLLLSKKYEASTTIVVEIKGTDPVLGGAVMMPQTIQGYLVTQADIIRSERVMNRVIDALGLERHPAMQAVAAEDTDATQGTPVRARIMRHFTRKLSVDPSREGTTITIAYEGTDPELTAAIVNGFAKAYIETGLELKTEPARNFQQWFEAQAKEYRERLESAQRKLSAAQQASGILANDERLDVENARLGELSQQLVLAQAALAESRGRAGASGRGGASMAEVVTNPLLQTLSGDLGRAEARMQQLSARLGPAHPEYQAAQNEVEQLRARLQTETARVGGSIAAGNDVNTRREAELRSLVAEQRARVAKIKVARDQLQVLEREVTSAQRALDLVAQRYTETSLESQSRQSNVSVLTPAAVPTMPSRPQPLVNSIVGGLLGLFIAVLAALTLESMQKPLRTSEDLLQASGVPVLAVLPPADSRRPQRLIGNTGPSIRPPALRLGH
ncbi:MAG TPA: chain length determinant protein EpsF [Burkholderiaceae bacterium]|nr:chain length determinant protein EpsF [Burkholderiaceae bacterium]